MAYGPAVTRKNGIEALVTAMGREGQNLYAFPIRLRVWCYAMSGTEMAHIRACGTEIAYSAMQSP
eukprot:1625280-Rhodomonas_salina.1